MRRRTWILLAVASLILLGIVLCIPRETPSDLEPFLLPSQKPSTIETGLYRYWIRARYEPIFSISATDLSDFDEAVRALRESVTILGETYNEHDRIILEENLYPFDFLERLRETEDARRVFIERPTIVHAIAYHRSLVQTITLYESSVKNSVSSLDSLPDARIGFSNGYSSARHVAEQMQTLQAHADVAHNEERQRLVCLIPFAPCKLPSVDAENKRSPLEDTRPSAKDDLFASILGASTLLSNPSDVQSESEIESSAPLYALTDPACEERDTAFFFIRWAHSNIASTSALRILSTDSLLFWDLEKRTDPIARFLAGQGVRYEFQPPNPYLCIDAGHDLSQIASAMYLRSMVSEHPIASESNPITADLAALERTIRNDRTASSQTIDAYVAEARRLLRVNGEVSLASQIGEDRVERLVALQAAWRDKSAYLPNLMIDMARLADTFRITSQGRNPILAYAFLTRGMLAQLYLLSNHSAVSEPLLLTEERTRNPLLEQGAIEYGSIMVHIPPEQLPSYITKQEQLMHTFESR